jgi:glycerate kinase
MKVLIASDSFKDALPALQVCQAIAKGIHLADKKIQTKIFPMADGGEGTSSILTHHFGGVFHEVEVHDPLHRKIKAHYGVSSDGQIAFIEMAQASGLQLLKKDERNCLNTSTLGTGELMLDAFNKGVKKIILGIWGSATNDVGMGMAQAFGYRFLDKAGNDLAPFGKFLNKVFTIDAKAVNSSLNELKVEVICDVDNPLFGWNGAAHVYARQKGANDDAILLLDNGMRHFTKVIQQDMHVNASGLPGAGAAGGLGAGVVTFFNGKLRRGIELVMELMDFEKQLENVDLVITGEGKLDGQTLHGKLIHGIVKKATQQGVSVIALCGALEATPEQIQSIGLVAAYSINKEVVSLAQALKMTERNLIAAAYKVIRSF